MGTEPYKELEDDEDDILDDEMVSPLFNKATDYQFNDYTDWNREKLTGQLEDPRFSLNSRFRRNRSIALQSMLETSLANPKPDSIHFSHRPD